MNKNVFSRLLPFVNLIPAALVVVLIASALPATKPVLREIPELLTIDAQASETEGEKSRDEEEKNENEQESAVKGNFTDGVYKGTGTGYGGTITVEVTVKDNSIVSIEILSAPGETASFLKRAEAVIDSMIASQSWDVDVVSGATYSSKGIMAAVKNALTGEKTEAETAPVSETKPLQKEEFEEPQGYVDGTYYGSAAGFGGTIQVKVLISGGTIADITIVSAPGETPSYLSSAKVVISRILAAQSPNVDTISGATYSSTGIINAVKKALSQAAGSGTADDLTVTEPAGMAAGNTQGNNAGNGAAGAVSQNKPAVAGKPTVSADGYVDGVYTGTGEGFGGNIKVQVTIKGGKITSVDILSAEDETPSFLEQARGVISRILSAQSTSVDVVSGATYSSEGIIQAVESALSKALPEEKTEQPETENQEQPGTETEKPETESPEQSGDGNAEQPGTNNTEQPETGEQLPVYIDGIYQAAAICSDDDVFLYTVQTTVTISEGRITDIAVLKLDDLSDFPESNDSYLDYAINGRMRKNIWYEGVVNQILTSQSTENVDAVSSATYSSNAITEAVRQSLIPAQEESIEEEIPVQAESTEEEIPAQAESTEEEIQEPALPENTAEETQEPAPLIPDTDQISGQLSLFSAAADFISKRGIL
ncbi:MAG: FMN-binding protein [Lachnospiraceae bacterium]